MTSLHLDIKPMTTALIHRVVWFIRSVSLHFRDQLDADQDSIKYLAQLQVDNISFSSFIHQCFNPTAKGHQICYAQFALSEATLAIVKHFFVWCPLAPFSVGCAP